jgi:hypothetical protein
MQTMPSILTPGSGPNGPGPIDARKRVTSVGEGSSVPYGASDNLYVNAGSMRGFVGIPAGSLRAPTTWYVRTGGSNTNGGSSVGTSADRTGADGSTTTGSRTFTAAGGAFTPADIGKGICIQTATNIWAKIESVTNATTVILTNPAAATASTLTWAIGGCWASLRPFLDCNTSTAQSTCGVQAGDTVYVGPGTYRATYVVGANYGAAWALTGATKIRNEANYNGRVSIIGDVTGVFTGDAAGPVNLTAYLTNDRTLPAITSNIATAPTQVWGCGANNLSFYNICFVIPPTGNNGAISFGSPGAQNLWMENCSFVGGLSASTRSMISITGLGASTATVTTQMPIGLMVDRCRFFVGQAASAVSVTGSATGTSDYDLAVVIQNCLVLGAGNGKEIDLASTGSGSARPGNVRLLGCTLLGGAVTAPLAAYSTVLPMRIYGGYFVCNTTAMNAALLGQIVEDYNIINAPTPRTNVTAGAHSISDGSYAPLFCFGQEDIWGGTLRAVGEPLPGSPLLGFVGDPSGISVAYDLRRHPRPAGAASALYAAAGALERSNSWVKETGTVRTGTSALSTTGPGYQDFSLAVDAALTTASVYMRYDSNYVGATPHMEVLDGEGCGVQAASSVAVVAVNTWEQLSLSFTPTAKGIVTIRVHAPEQSGAGKAFADDFSVS